MNIKRVTYFFYYIKKLDIKKFKCFLNYAALESGKAKMALIADAFSSVFVYNISILEYFQFRFFEKDKQERKKWAGTGFLYEFQLKMNPIKSRMLLEDKIRFLNHFNPFIKRLYADIQRIKSDPEMLQLLLTNSTGRVVLKGSHGQVGAEVEVVSCKDFSPSALIRYMTEKKYDLVEEYVIQHKELMDLSPTGLNTVRIFTQLSEGFVHILGARLRISVNSPVDNMAAGNLAAPVDIESGKITGPGVFSDITKEDKEVHPVTGKAITGFVVPHWNSVIELSRKAALQMPENRSIGWDIAITNEGAELIEGNHNWCKLLWQMPVKQGLKNELVKFL